MSFDLRASAKERLFLVAHRGVWGGNIPCNTIPAYEAALREGADMIEIDIDRTAEGDLEGSRGWIADRGFDLMQTDWVLSAATFFEQTGRRLRKPLC